MKLDNYTVQCPVREQTLRGGVKWFKHTKPSSYLTSLLSWTTKLRNALEAMTKLCFEMATELSVRLGLHSRLWDVLSRNLF